MEIRLNWWRLLVIFPLVIIWFFAAVIELIIGKRIVVANWCLDGIRILCEGAK
jgi:hypothetical protein